MRTRELRSVPMRRTSISGPQEHTGPTHRPPGPTAWAESLDHACLVLGVAEHRHGRPLDGKQRHASQSLASGPRCGSLGASRAQRFAIWPRSHIRRIKSPSMQDDRAVVPVLGGRERSAGRAGSSPDQGAPWRRVASLENALAHARWCARTEARGPGLPCLTSPTCPDSRTNWRALGDFLRRWLFRPLSDLWGA
jgi:hypothetical protein